MPSGIYEIRNKINGKVYIGSSNDIKQRWRGHLHLLRKGKHHSPHLQSAWIKHGEFAFEFKVLENVPAEKLIKREQQYLDEMQPFGDRGYNMCLFAFLAPMTGRNHTTEAKEKMAIGHTGQKRFFTPEHRRNISISRLGQKQSPEVILQQALTRSKNHPKKTQCSVPGCSGVYVARGLCRKHYSRLPDVKKKHRDHCNTPEYKAYQSLKNAANKLAKKLTSFTDQVVSNASA